MKPETIAIHTPNTRRDGEIAPAISLTTTFEHGPDNELLHGYQYIRTGNPNVSDLEEKLAAVEGGIECLTFASGMAAGTAVLHTMRPGAIVLFHTELYFLFGELIRQSAEKLGLDCRQVDLRDADAVFSELDDEIDLVWFETPSNPCMELIDIERIVTHANSVGAKTLIDGTFATPAIQNPIELGVDIVLHSLTKGIGGHSDVQGGALIFSSLDKQYQQIAEYRNMAGNVLSPFNAWLIARGLTTLHCRIEKQSQNAVEVATAMEAHPMIKQVHYPFLESGPDIDLAKRQMKLGGSMLSLELKGGAAKALMFAAKVKLFVNATSLGGVESLIEHRKSVEGEASTAPGGLIRISIGLEHSRDLIDDLEQALASITV